MCIASLFAGAGHPRWRLVVAANRDEFHDRPAAPLARWGNGIIAGKDLRSGGTWLGASEAGRLVLVTNYRAPGYPQPDRPSRGTLVTALLEGADPGTIAIAPYNPFNLFVADAAGAHLLANYPAERRQSLPEGIHGLSNGDFSLPWPKTRQLNAAMAAWLAENTDDLAALFAALREETPRAQELPADAPADTLPEPRFGAVFIADPTYGTRCSTVVAIAHDGAGLIAERRFDREGQATGETVLDFHCSAFPGSAPV